MLNINKLIILFFIAFILVFIYFAEYTYKKNLLKYEKLTVQKPVKYPRFVSNKVLYDRENLQQFDRLFIYNLQKGVKKNTIYLYHDFNDFYIYINQNLLRNPNILNYE